MLRLDDPAPLPAMDDFMVAEGYAGGVPRLYQRVSGCWCGGDDLDGDPAGPDPRFRHYQTCRACGCLLLRHVLRPDGLAELYGPRYFREHQQAIGLPPIEVRYENDALDRIPIWLGRVAAHAPPAGRVLEVGSSNGRFVRELAASGYDVVGLELDREVAAWARERTGCDIRAAELGGLEDRGFHVVIANDVLEHLYDPRAFAAEALGHLVPGGVAMFQTVVFDDASQCPTGMLRPLYHTILYSRRSLPLLDSAAGTFTGLEDGAFGYHFVVMRAG